MMITYNVYIQIIQYKFNLYILKLPSKLFPQEYYKIVALFNQYTISFDSSIVLILLFCINLHTHKF